ncbi:hypothetical protein HHI36_011148 [Cryptolaemus montrouzieri]|uniref:Uncharacterized protein n=1 Tax=Cryptolaemus montrouzieri TaxID=559131 RepID=A0ABD2MKV9_9CUCU
MLLIFKALCSVLYWSDVYQLLSILIYALSSCNVKGFQTLDFPVGFLAFIDCMTVTAFLLVSRTIMSHFVSKKQAKRFTFRQLRRLVWTTLSLHNILPHLNEQSPLLN